VWRHGRTSWNAEGRFQGQADPPLDERGRGQASAAAELLVGLAPDRIVSSDLRRAQQTAQILATRAGLPLQVEPRLREIHLGRWQGLLREEVATLYPQEYADWLAGHTPERGGERRSEVADRAVAAVGELCPADDGRGGEAAPALTVVVTHGGTALALVGRLLGLPERHWRIFASLGNCRWSILRRNERGWRLVEHNGGVTLPALPGGPVTGTGAGTGAGTGTGTGTGTAVDTDASPDLEPGATPSPLATSKSV